MTQGLALFLSILLELPIALGLVAALRWLERPAWPRLLLVGAAATLLTHPFAWNGFGWLRPTLPDYWARAVIIEGSVAVVEGLLYARLADLGLRRGLITGFAANGFSFGVGLLIVHAMRGG